MPTRNLCLDFSILILDFILSIYFTEKGDVTVYEWKTGVVPTSVEKVELDLKAVEENQEEDTIDFGLDLDLDVDAGADIDWGISSDDAPAEDTKVCYLAFSSNPFTRKFSIYGKNVPPGIRLRPSQNLGCSTVWVVSNSV